LRRELIGHSRGVSSSPIGEGDVGGRPYRPVREAVSRGVQKLDRRPDEVDLKLRPSRAISSGTETPSRYAVLVDQTTQGVPEGCFLFRSAA
jgi:hypothetical protein